MPEPPNPGPGDPAPEGVGAPPHEPDDAAPLRWSVETRLRFIDERLFWEGRINRSDLMRRFLVSTPQAASDLKRYLGLAPANLAYDSSERCYRATPGFTPAFGTPDAEAWLRDAAAHPSATLPEIALLPLPARAVDAEWLRRVVAAIREGARLALLYQSMRRDQPVWREVTPRALASDGLRWHLRAFCHRDEAWEDFLFPRMVELGPMRVVPPPPPQDEAWERLVVVRLVPAAWLGPAQAASIVRDYGMVADEDSRPERRIPVRQALLPYFMRRLRLDVRDALVEAANRDELDEALAGWNAERGEGVTRGHSA